MAAAAPSVDGFICIYPAYINGKKTLAEGRRIPKERCVDNPTVNEIRDVCTAAGLKAVTEDKLYSREMFRGDVMLRGRVRVQLKTADKVAVMEQFQDKRSLMLYLGEMIPKLKSRSQKSGGSEQVQQKGKKNQRRKR